MTEKEQNDFLGQIQSETKKVLEELLEKATLQSGDILVVGCSSSEIQSQRIGSHSSEEIGKAVFDTLYEETEARKIYLAAQCCEHLNRAIVLERKAAKKYGYIPVNAVPKVKAGGSFGTAAYQKLKHPTVVEEVKAKAGIDIGDTLIGMHILPVAVPVRIEQKSIGGAHVVCARSRVKYIGGPRACYDENLM